MLTTTADLAEPNWQCTQREHRRPYEKARAGWTPPGSAAGVPSGADPA